MGNTVWPIRYGHATAMPIALELTTILALAFCEDHIDAVGTALHFQKKSILQPKVFRETTRKR